MLSIKDALFKNVQKKAPSKGVHGFKVIVDEPCKKICISHSMWKAWRWKLLSEM